MAIDLKNVAYIPSALPWVSVAVGSQIGGRAENQDSVRVADTPFGLLVTVCDGMGGGPGGATASYIAVSEIVAGVIEGNPEEARINIVIKAIRRANEAILQREQEEPELQGMGSTCTVVLINEESAICAHVGDSRIYQLRRKGKHWRTFDHSMVFELVRQGVITEEQARLSAQSNVITRALGIKMDVQVEASERAYERGDRFVLTTDGVHGAMPEKDLIKMLTAGNLPQDTIIDITQEVEQAGIRGGGHHDNHTIAVLDVKQDSKYKEPMTRKMRQIFVGILSLLAASIITNLLLICCTSSHAETPIINIPPRDTVKVEEKMQLPKVDTIQSRETLRSLLENSYNKIDTLTEVITGLRSQNDTLRMKIDQLSKNAKTTEGNIHVKGDLNARKLAEFEQVCKQKLNGRVAAKDIDDLINKCRGSYENAKKMLKDNMRIWKINKTEYDDIINTVEKNVKECKS